MSELVKTNVDQESFIKKLLPATVEKFNSLQNNLLLISWLIHENKTEENFIKSLSALSQIISASFSILKIYNLDNKRNIKEHRFINYNDHIFTEDINQIIFNKVKILTTSSIIQFNSTKYVFYKDLKDRLKNCITILSFPLKHDEHIIGLFYLGFKKCELETGHNMLDFINRFLNNIIDVIFEIYFSSENPDHSSIKEIELRSKYEFDIILGQHPRIIDVLKTISLVAYTDATVLIQGESGTGKELVASALHMNSSRKNKPFIPINCGALSENLLESELFGHVKGAFTGALKDKRGWFEIANGGTIFLDEVGKMSPSLQVDLLRILQTGEYSQVGSPEIKHCDVRIIAATDKDLKKMVASGKFREEVFYRLNVVEIDLPPLRERRSDIILLARHFLEKFKQKYDKNHISITDSALSLLQCYDYPGNVRELQNVIERAVVLAENSSIDINDLPASIQCKEIVDDNVEKLSPFKISKQKVIDNFEYEYISECLRTTKGNISKAARSAGINIKNFYMKMKKCGIDPLSFKKST